MSRDPGPGAGGYEDPGLVVMGTRAGGYGDPGLVVMGTRGWWL